MPKDCKGRTSGAFCTRAFRGAENMALAKKANAAVAKAAGRQAWAKAKAVWDKHHD